MRSWRSIYGITVVILVVSCVTSRIPKTYFSDPSLPENPSDLASKWNAQPAFVTKTPRGELHLSIQRADPAKVPTVLASDSFDVQFWLYHVRSMSLSRVDKVELYLGNENRPLVLDKKTIPLKGPDIRDTVDREMWDFGRIYVPNYVDTIRAEFTVQSTLVRHPGDYQAQRVVVTLIRLEEIVKRK